MANQATPQSESADFDGIITRMLTPSRTAMRPSTVVWERRESLEFVSGPLAYWVVDGLFGAMGNVNYLPAPLAAWSSDVLFGLVGGYLLLRTPT